MYIVISIHYLITTVKTGSIQNAIADYNDKDERLIMEAEHHVTYLVLLDSPLLHGIRQVTNP